jgi:hypothetical protein
VATGAENKGGSSSFFGKVGGGIQDSLPPQFLRTSILFFPSIIEKMAMFVEGFGILIL